MTEYPSIGDPFVTRYLRPLHFDFMFPGYHPIKVDLFLMEYKSIVECMLVLREGDCILAKHDV